MFRGTRSNSATPLVSLVSTLTFPRGQLRKFLASWELQQGVDRQQIEVILVSKGSNPGIENQARQLLHPHDRFLSATGLSEPELYNLGVQHAHAEWVLITEPHIVASADCIQKLLNTVQHSSLEGACVRTVPADDENWVAECESRMYADDLQILSDPDDWRKITKRGTLFRRRTFLEAGGFPVQYGAYAETALAELLKQQGSRLGFAASATIRHYNSTELQELLDYIWEYRQGACLYREERSETPAAQSSSVTSVSAGRLSPRQRHIIRSCVWQSLTRTIQQFRNRPSWLALWIQFTTWVFLLTPGLSLFGKTAGMWLRCCLLRISLSWISSASDRYDAFKSLWTLWGDLAELRYRAGGNPAGFPSSISIDHTSAITAADLPVAATLGLHEPEEYQQQSFRWLEPVSCFFIQAEPASCIIQLEFLKVCRSFSQLQVFWNEDLLCPLDSSTDGTLIFQILSGQCQESDTQILTLVSPPLRTTNGERRQLGTPLVQLSLQPARITPSHSLPSQRASA